MASYTMRPPRAACKSPSAHRTGPAIQAHAWSAQGRSPSPAAALLPSLRKPPTAAAPSGSLPPVRGGAVVGPQADKENPVAALLGDLGLRHHAAAVLRAGFDDIETLLDMEDADMQDVGMSPHDITKLRRSLQEMRGEGDGGPESPMLDESNPVVEFMQGAGLGQYAEILLRHGFEDLETLAEIEDGDLKDLGVPRGHQVKLRIRLREYEEGLGHQAQADVALSLGSTSAAPCQQPLANPSGLGFRTSINPEQTKSAVVESWEQVQRLGVNHVGEVVKNTLFDIAPNLIDLFPAEVRHKYREWTADEGFEELDVRRCPGLRKLFGKVVAAVGSAVAGFHEPTRLVPILSSLGARHANYGASQEHWDLLGEALNRALKLCLADAYKPEVEVAWMTVYKFVAAVMLEGLRGSLSRVSSAHSTGSTEVPKAWPSTPLTDGADGSEVSQDLESVAPLNDFATQVPSCSEKNKESGAPRPDEGASGEDVNQKLVRDRADSCAAPSDVSSEAVPEPEREETPSRDQGGAQAPLEAEAGGTALQVSLFGRIKEAKAFWQARTKGGSWRCDRP